MKKDNYVRPKGWLPSVLAVFTLLYLLGICTWILIFHPILHEIENRVLGQLFAVCAAYQARYLKGTSEVSYNAKTASSSMAVKLGGAFAIYVLTFWLWAGPVSPVVTTSSVRQETSSFAEDFERKLAEIQAALLKVSPNARNTPDFEGAMKKAIGQAKAEIDRFRSSHKLTEAENRRLDNLIQRLPNSMQIVLNESSGQPADGAEQFVTNNYTSSTILSRTVTNDPSNAGNSNSEAARTNIFAGVSSDPASASQGTETNTTVTIPTVNLPENTVIPAYQSVPSPSLIPSAVSNALAANFDTWVSRYPDGFTIQYQMRIFGPYNAPSGKYYSFINIPIRPENTVSQYGGGMVFLPTISYVDHKFSKPVHMRFDGRLQVDGNLMRSIRQWHILPVASYIESVRGEAGQQPIFVVGNGPDENWQSGLYNSIQPYFYQLDQYFPNGFYMVTADGKELNIFKSVDPNSSALWSNTSVTKQQLGWQVAFPPEVVYGRELQTLSVPYPNQLVTLKIEGDQATNTIGVIEYQFQSGPVFFMGIRNN